MPPDTRDECMFYSRIGSCRHGEKCSRVHVAPTRGRIILIHNLYRIAKLYNAQSTCQDAGPSATAEQVLDSFYLEVYRELALECGAIEELGICDNEGGHLDGHVYVQFEEESSAEEALLMVESRFFAGVPISGHLTAIEDLREAECKQFNVGQCSRGGQCNFLHLLRVDISCRTAAREEVEKIRRMRELRRKVEEKRKRRKDQLFLAKKDQDDTDGLPSKYRVVEESSSSSSSSASPSSRSLSPDSGRSTPRAFRMNESSPDNSSSEGESIVRERELAVAQMRRRLRWKSLQNRLGRQSNETFMFRVL